MPSNTLTFVLFVLACGVGLYIWKRKPGGPAGPGGTSGKSGETNKVV